MKLNRKKTRDDGSSKPQNLEVVGSAREGREKNTFFLQKWKSVGSQLWKMGELCSQSTIVGEDKEEGSMEGKQS